MSTRVGDIYVDMSLRFQNLTSGIRQVTGQVATLGTSLGRNFGTNLTNSANAATQSIDNMGGSLDRVSRIVKGILISQAFYAGIHAIQSATSSLFEFNNQMEVAQVSFTLMLDSAEDAGNYLSALEDFAATTPFQMKDATAAAQRLMAMGFAAKNVVPTLRTLTDAASLMGASPEVIGRITMALGQMQTEGFITGRQIRSLGMAGIPALQILQEELGVTKKELQNIGKLKIPGDMGAEAILRGMHKRYENASALIARTNTGLISTIKDDFLLIGRDVMAGPFAVVHTKLTNIADTMERVRKMFRTEGMKGLFEDLVPAHMQTTVLALASGISYLMSSIKNLWNAFGPLRIAMFEFFVRFGTVFIPIIGVFIDSIASLVAYVSQASPVVKLLGSALTYLLIASVVGMMVRGLAASLALLQVASIAGAAVHYLAAAFRLLALAMIANPIGFIVSAIAASLAILAMQSDTVSNALDALMTRLAALFGIDFGSMLAVGTKGSAEEIAKYNDEMGSINDAMSDMGDEAEDADKKAAALKKNLMSFDQVHTLDDPASGGKDDDKARDWKLPAGDFKMADPVFDEPIKGLGLDKLKIPTPPWIAALLAALAALKMAWDKWVRPKPPPPTPPDEPKGKKKPGPKPKPKPVPEPAAKPTSKPTPPEPKPVGRPSPYGPPEAPKSPYGPPEAPKPKPVPAPAPRLSDDLQRRLDDIFKEKPAPAPNTEPFGPPKPKRARSPKKVFTPDPASGLPVGQQKRSFEEGIKDAARQKRKEAAQRKKDVQPAPVKEPVKGMPDEEFQEFLRKIGAMGTALVGLGVIVNGFKTNLGQAYTSVSTFGNSLATSVVTGLASAELAFGTTMTSVQASVSTGITNAGTFFSNGLSIIGTKTSEWATNAQTTWSGHFAKVGTFWENHKVAILTVGGLTLAGLALVFTGGLAGIGAGVVSAGGTIATSVGAWAGGLGVSAGLATAAISGRFNALPGTISTLMSRIPNIIGNALTGASGLIAKFGSWAGKLNINLGGGGGGGPIPSFAPFSKGGILTKDSIIRAAENGHEAVVPLSGGGMKPFAQAIAAELGGSDGANGSNGSSGSSGGVNLQVGILIGDERSYRELERRLKSVRLGEQARGAV